ncbi:sulfite exporter TauE/SafE family protein [Gluconobacter wancherniae]|uniref:Probable membrane transporter protein n=1 Tax=Gluconobacter wancherniae NBRC 103581 TaxID=656744 RepID=A0A511B469_9PROT|nr:sulfite exporter TauE/SafE family protein [Gluconobacter wancherniae]MBF0852794.1 sulfite exporter TauE/SafE family protein [Gluconobacter wancherniae]GBD56492.1 UPF0721 transmembrane protein [Gluconobacter wancherniae NBRC 103581]GBR63974.1 hypothetical protein AA103581_1078 [Gluconobacter wancherniae NBRC 103581]GEK92607.1 UPF0721 transmembrane protein [Gluconobacter wancherniae NBRC 103581]
MPHSWLYSISGLLVGFLVGMTGVGGGSLMTPLLILLFGVKPQSAVGTDLIYAAVTKIVGTSLNGRLGTVQWSIVGWLMAGSVPGAVFCLMLLHHLGTSPISGRLVQESLGVCLLMTAPAVLFRPKLQLWASRREPLKPATVNMLTVLMGLVLGIMVTMSSVGAGAVGMAALVILYPMVSTRVLVATDIAHAVPLTLIAGGGHWVEGTTDFGVLVRLLAGSIPGILLGTWCAGVVREDIQRWFLGILLAIIGLRMI